MVILDEEVAKLSPAKSRAGLVMPKSGFQLANPGSQDIQMLDLCKNLKIKPLVRLNNVTNLVEEP